MSQTDGRTDGRHAIPRPRICTKVHCAVKTVKCKTSRKCVLTVQNSVRMDLSSFVCFVKQKLICRLPKVYDGMLIADMLTKGKFISFAEHKLKAKSKIDL